ncbi:MAG: hypothetical protein H6605_10420 [Flavobacteriales bacterium]|nr:hypothetical protein [Flavobacteriales bacterium]
MNFAFELAVSALKSCFNEPGLDMNSERIETLKPLFYSDLEFLNKVQLLDAYLKKQAIPENTRELLFDILLYNFFSEDSERLEESFFESKSWDKIENAILDRGTELLNLMLYLQECKDSGIKADLDDYLDEYLTADEEFENEEFEVYEDIIKNRDVIADGNVHTMLEIAAKNSDSELGDQLLPILLFFETTQSRKEKLEAVRSFGSAPEFQATFLTVLYEFDKINLNLN